MPARALTSLHVTNFRCYPTLHLQVEPRPVVLTGPNGAGKTNILEAISFLSPGRGLRQASLAEILNQNPNPNEQRADAFEWGVATILETADGEKVEIGTSYHKSTPNKRFLKIAGKAMKDQKALAEVVNIAWLIPAMDGLFMGGTRDRRQFFDRLAYAFHPSHATLVAQYEKLLKERMSLLQEGHYDPLWMSTLEQQLAGVGVAIAASRNDTIRILQQAIDQTTSSFPHALIAIEGACEVQLQASPAVMVEDWLKESLMHSRIKDQISGRSHVGIHTSDMIVHHGTTHMPANQCSTGEQKALLLSIILAHIRAKVLWHAHPPIVLLDEVVAHLDIQRRHALFDELLSLNSQAWLTGTDPVLFEGLRGKAQFMRVEAEHLVLG